MEAEKTHSLPPATCRQGKPVASEYHSLRTGSADDVSANCRAGEHQYLSSSSQGTRENSTFLCLFILFRPSRDWITSTHTGEVHLLYSAQVNLTDSLRNNV